jgi:hypothetical protein
MPSQSESLPPDPLQPRSRLARFESLLRRFPWLIPSISFAAGWAGYVLVQRGDDFARSIALIALIGWLWLLIEPLLRRYLERRKEGVGNFVANFLSQSMQQEMLFFCLPLMIGATQKDAGQIAFTALAGSAALLTTVDPLY